MSSELLVRAPLGLLPVLIFLAVLLYMDSYKLVGLRAVLTVIGSGVVMVIIAYLVSLLLLEQLQLDRGTLIRYVAPVIEEPLVEEVKKVRNLVFTKLHPECTLCHFSGYSDLCQLSQAGTCVYHEGVKEMKSLRDKPSASKEQ